MSFLHTVYSWVIFIYCVNLCLLICIFRLFPSDVILIRYGLTLEFGGGECFLLISSLFHFCFLFPDLLIFFKIPFKCINTLLSVSLYIDFLVVVYYIHKLSQSMALTFHLFKCRNLSLLISLNCPPFMTVLYTLYTLHILRITSNMVLIFPSVIKHNLEN